MISVVVLLLVDIARVVVTKNETQHPQKKMSIQSIYAWLWHLLGKMISHYPGKRPKQCGGSKRIMYYQVHDDVNFDDNVDDDDVIFGTSFLPSTRKREKIPKKTGKTSQKK